MTRYSWAEMVRHDHVGHMVRSADGGVQSCTECGAVWRLTADARTGRLRIEMDGAPPSRSRR